jgi:L-serine kinase (ATP) / ParB family transcriptional regulator, heme-responsive regulator
VGEPFDLRVVPMEAVVPHEEADPHRVERLVGRLDADEVLVNPPVVAAAGDHFVLLDGATRIAAFNEMGFRYAIVQVAPTSGLRLETWSHVICDVTPDRVVHVLARVPEIRLAEDGDGDGDPTMCTVRLVDGRTFVVHPTEGRHPFTALNPMVAAYLGISVIARTTAEAVDYPDAAGVVVFPRLTVDAVFDAAREGHRLPAGITRFIVAGRVILLNAPLAPLRADRTVDEHNAWLHDLVATRRARGHIRYYPEAVYVLDD